MSAAEPWWRPWVPRPVALGLCAGTPPTQLSGRGPGAVLFADVSGFTALGEALAHRGPGGAELLHRALVDAFTPLVRKIGRAGGWVAKFGGDALTAVFEGPDGLAAAAACALDLQQGVSRATTRAGGPPELAAHPLALKIGLGAGEVAWCVAGDPERRLELLLWGDALDRAVGAEHAASRGEVLTAALLPTFDASEGPAAGVWRLHHAPAPPARARRAPVQGDHPAGAAFLHPVVAERLRQGHARFVQEHRRVTVAFVRFEAPREESVLRERVAALVAAAGRWGGHLDKVDLGDKGNVALFLFGAPVAHEDDGERALRLCLELDRTMGVAAGVHAGLVHAGAFGAPERSEYTVLGDAVNLAARLMQAARPGVVLASREVVSGLVRRLDAGAATELRVKGRSTPVTAFPVKGFRRTRLVREGGPAPFVGRHAELAAAAQALRAARDGRGRTVVVTGDAGLGKSRFVEELLREAEGMGFVVTGGAARPHAQEPWEVWQDVWRELLPWSADEPAELVRKRLRALEPAHEIRAPLLAGPLGAPLPSAPALEALDDAARFRATAEVLISVLSAAAAAAPRVLVLEDAQWLDAPSRELLAVLCGAIARLPVLVLVATRADDRAWLRDLGGRPGVATVPLAPLGERECASLVGHLWPDGAIEAGRLADRTGGNPFFVEEWVRWVRERGDGDGEVPRTLQALVQARLDQLAEHDRITLKAASVIGRRFRLSWLRACVPELGDEGGLARRLDGLARVEITHSDDGPGAWRFRHAVTRETAYGTLTDATRRELHRRLATTLAAEPDPDAIAVAWHFGQSDDEDGADTWFRRAGAAAARAGDPAAAAQWYERWLTLGRTAGRAAVLVELGRLAFRAAAPARAERSWSDALAASAGEPAAGLAARIGLATVWMDAGRRSEALALAEEARAAADRAGLRDPDAVSARTLLAQLRRESDPEGARAAALEAFALAETLPEPWCAGRAAAIVGTVLLRRPEDVPEAEPWLARARALAERAEDPLGVARAASNQAVAYWWTGRAFEATEAWGRTVAECQRLGDLSQAWTVYGNLAQVHLNRRSVVSARPMQALRCDHETRTGRWNVAASALPSLLQTAYFHPDLWELAAEAAPLVLEVGAAAGSAYWRAIGLASAALVAWRAGRDRRALDWARECLALPPDGVVDEAQGWAACWGQLAGRRTGSWTPEDDARVALVAAAAGPRSRPFFAAARALAGRDVEASLAALDLACAEQGDVFLHAIREVAWGRPMAPPPPLAPPPDMGRPAPGWEDLLPAIRERWARRAR